MEQQPNRPLLGIGSCLTGKNVRYDGKSNPPNAHVRAVTQQFDTRAFCPEVGIGLGVPRRPIHLVGEYGSVRVKDAAAHEVDHTAAISTYAEHVLQSTPWLCGYILVSGSPSCGFDQVKRFNEQGQLLARDARGVFASSLARLDPLLPLEDDGRLRDPQLCESFVSRARTYHEWKRLQATDFKAADLLKFYRRRKYLVMAHDIIGYRELGPMLANAGREPLAPLAERFISRLMQALSLPATRRGYTNVLSHLAGYLKRNLCSEQRQHMAQTIDEYRRGLVPLTVPVTLLRHHLADHPNAYIADQVLLEPHPPGPGLGTHQG